MTNKITILILLLTLLSSINADNNGVWHNAEDVKGGTFGSDEQNMTFYFNNSVYGINFSSNIYYDRNNESFFLDMDKESNFKNANFKKIKVNNVNLDKIYLNTNEKASNSDKLDGLDSTAFQKKITYKYCPNGISSISSLGTITCKSTNTYEFCDAYGKCIKPKFACQKIPNEKINGFSGTESQAGYQVAQDELGGNCHDLSNAIVKGFSNTKGAWGKSDSWYWDGKSYSNLWSIWNQISKKLKTEYEKKGKPVKSVTFSSNEKVNHYRWWGDLRNNCKGDTIPYSSWDIEIEFHEKCEVFNTK